MADAPTVLRRRLGAELRRLREGHGRKLDEVAAELGLVASTLSRIERGQAPIRTAYLKKLLDMYELTDPAMCHLLIEMAREGHRKAWWSDYDDVLPSGFNIYLGLEAEAASIRSYEPTLVHGLLQTSDYATAVLRELRPREDEEQLQRMVELRMQRQRQRLEDVTPPIDLWLILDEGAIRRVVGGPSVMRQQLEALIEAASRTNVVLQVLSFDSGAHAGMDGPFAIVGFREPSDPDVAVVDSIGGTQVFLEKDKEVRTRIEAFDRMRAAALSPPATIRLIQSVMSELG
ncbi:MAG TPA: helix-turn-helix transcriptional regulator [Streptosporangiaceae bacterium]|nr:helix-turn-helix transcriptional regulator [Streptosporangiaceae bacterium]